ncbi:MAG TPA: bifunctional 4-hydroxy-2-oxoglutarate aldolase/2-dehydro-3-deoxy-phosphogluconate aldolase [Tepidisphaeraceae bacterium]|nr:bifunctional 4-hydroxy-2-oxoglutarate aldolase/2-dehydro-3-deoxy-phosphogluconate aldolase [Tepidisphaeraceae bacterium]
MPKSKEHYFQQLADCGVIAVIRAPSKDLLPDIADALVAGGVLGIEVTMSTPKAIEGIELLADRMGDKIVIGVGTVLDAATAADAIHAGAQFVLSPAFDPEVVATTKRYGKISVPGAFTPTEIVRAWTAGADVVKVFPSTALGPAYFKDILAPLPQIKLTPTGGVDVKNAGEWIKAGAVFLGAGSALVSKDAMNKKDWAGITANAKAFTEAVRAARAK